MSLDDRVREIEVEMAAHESQCEERWKTTFNRLNDIDDHLQRIENRILALVDAHSNFSICHCADAQLWSSYIVVFS